MLMVASFLRQKVRHLDIKMNLKGACLTLLQVKQVLEVEVEVQHQQEEVQVEVQHQQEEVQVEQQLRVDQVLLLLQEALKHQVLVIQGQLRNHKTIQISLLVVVLKKALQQQECRQ